MEYVQNLLLDIIKGVASRPDEVETVVSTQTDEKGELVMVNVKVHRSDVGICIGEGGKTAEAIRKVVGIVGFSKIGKRVYVRIDTPKRQPIE